MKRETDGEHMSVPVCFLKHIFLSLSRSAHIYTTVRQTVHLFLSISPRAMSIHAMSSSYTMARIVLPDVCVCEGSGTLEGCVCLHPIVHSCLFTSLLLLSALAG